MLRLLRWAPAASWMFLIFSFSTEVGAPQRTSRFFEPFFRGIFPTISPEQLDFLHLLFRKAGHLTEYAILAALLWWALDPSRHGQGSNRKRSIMAFLLSVLYAATDEFHQAFVPARGAAVTDVLIDATGAALSLLAIAGILILAKRWGAQEFLGRFGVRCY